MGYRERKVKNYLWNCYFKVLLKCVLVVEVVLFLGCFYFYYGLIDW